MDNFFEKWRMSIEITVIQNIPEIREVFTDFLNDSTLTETPNQNSLSEAFENKHLPNNYIE